MSMEASPVAQDLAMEEWINGIAQASAGRLSNLANTTAVGVWTPEGFKTPRDAYIALIDQTAAQMASGKYGLNAAVRSVLKQFADAGLSVVEYESGRTRSLGAAVEMNLKEATSMVYQGVQERIGQEFGADGVEISAHWDCAPDHLDVQGKQYSKAAFEKLQGTLARPIGKLNCRHKIYSIILGISEPNYSEEELHAMKEASLRKKKFDGKEYTPSEASQVQRRLEREIRKQKNRSVLAASAGDDEMRREAQMKINQLTGKYKDLSDTFGLKTKAERMQVSGYRPVSVKDKKQPSKNVPELSKPIKSLKTNSNLQIIKTDPNYPSLSEVGQQAYNEIINGTHISNNTLKGIFGNKDEIENVISYVTGVDKNEAAGFLEVTRAYVGNEHRSIRHYQQGIITDETETNYIKPRAEALEKLIIKSPKWSGGPTYRSVGISDSGLNDIIQKVNNGAVISMEGTSSWSSSKEVADSWDVHQPNKVIYICNTQNKGTSIRAYSNIPYEFEVLSSKEAKYKPISYWRENEITYIQLEELE